MRSIILILLPFLLYFIISISCGPRNPSQMQLILGKWNMEKVYEAGKDVTSNHNPDSNRWIKFHTNQRFDSDGELLGPNSGNWTIDLKSGELFLDSDIGEEDDSYWKVQFEDKKMKWKGSRTEFAENFELFFHKN